MKTRPQFLTPIQNVALNLVFDVMREPRMNRTYQEYMAISARLPPLKVLLFLVNERLQQIHKSERGHLYEICRFKAGDKRYTYEPFPTKITDETLRAALTISGMRLPKHAWRRKPLPKERPKLKRRPGVKPRRT